MCWRIFLAVPNRLQVTVTVLLLTHCGSVDTGSESQLWTVDPVPHANCRRENDGVRGTTTSWLPFLRIIPVCQPCSTSQYRRVDYSTSLLIAMVTLFELDFRIW